MPVVLADLLARTSELSALPATTVRLLDLLDEPEAAAAPVLEVVETDPALTANLLKLCNSAFYSMPREIGTLREALVLLGNQTVITLAFATSMGRVLRGPLSGYRSGQHEMWHHALATAVAAAAIAESLSGPAQRSRAFTAGLLHDIGKQLLNRPLMQGGQQIPPHCRADQLLAAERSILGCDHTQAGAALAEMWRFPPALVAAIACHHRPQDADEYGELATAVWAGNLMAGEIETAGDAQTSADDALRETLIAAGIPNATLDELETNLARQLDEILAVSGESL